MSIRILMKTYSLMLPIANYAALALVDIGFFALIPLFFATPIEIGGLGLSPSIIGTYSAISGLCNGLFQVLFVSKLIDRFGEKRIFCTAVMAYFPLIAFFPMMSWVAQSHHKVGPMVWTLVVLQRFFSLITNMAYCMSVFLGTRELINPQILPPLAAISVFITRTAPNKHSLGTMNGLSQTTTSIARAIGPAAFSSIFAFSKESNILGGNLVYLIFFVLACFLVLLSRFLPDPNNSDDENTSADIFPRDV